MKSMTILKCAGLAFLGSVLLAAPASAQLSTVGTTKPLVFQASALIGNDDCYDPANHIYLAVAAYGTVWGAFVTTTGDSISTFGIGTSNGSSPFGHYARCVYSPELNGGHGGFLVGWSQNDGVPDVIHTAVVAYPAGELAGSEQIISDGTQGGTYPQDGPALAYSSTSHRILVAWTTYSWNTQGRFVDAATGAPVSAIIPYVPAPAGGGSRDPSLAWNPATNQFALGYAAWNGSGAFVGFILIKASDGSASPATTFGFSKGTFNATVAVNSKNDYVMGWTLGNAAMSIEFDQNGTLLNSGQLISNRIGTATSLDIAYNKLSNTILAVGEDQLSPNVAGVELSQDGAALGATIGLTTGAKTGSFVPRLSARSDAREWDISLTQNMNQLANQVVQTTTSFGVTVNSLTPNMTSPVAAGMTVGYTASATGGTGSITYQFWQWRPGRGWTLLQDFSSSNTALVTMGIGPNQVRVIAHSADGVTPDGSMDSAMFQGTKTRALTFTKDNTLGGVLTYNPSTGGVTAFTGNGVALSTVSLGTGYSVYPGDFNGDGLTDFVAYNASTGDVRMYLNDTANGFVDKPVSGTHNWAPGWTLTVLDFNGDGYSDLFLYNPNTGVWWRFMATAMSTGVDLVPYETGKWGSGWTIYTGDFNGDGYADLFLFNKNGSSDPNSGRWYQVLYSPAFGPNLGGFVYTAGDVRWAPYWQVHMGDFNGDGKTDLFLYGPDGTWFKVYLTDTGAIYDGWQTYGKWANSWQIVEGKFTTDGMTDLLLYDPGTGRTILAKGQPFGFDFVAGPFFSPGLQFLGTDFNADGLTDLWTINPSDGTFVQFTMSGASVLSSGAPGWFGTVGLSITSSGGTF